MAFLWVIIVVGLLGWTGYRWRPMRIVGVIIAFIVIGLAGLVQSIDLPDTPAAPPSDTSIIRNYDLQYDVAADGAQRLVETLDVEFTETKRGIFRFFDESDGIDADVTHPVTVESVQRCRPGEPSSCAPEPYTEYYENGSLVAKIGDADVTYRPGTVNRYIITSTTRDAITAPRGTSLVQWYWDVIGAGWAMDIEKAKVTVRFPVQPDEVRCLEGPVTCRTEATGDGIVTGSYRALPPGTPVTWQADLPSAGLSAVPVGEEPAGQQEPPAWWRTWLVLIPGAVLGLLMALAIRALRDRPADDTPVFAEPTPDILPAVWTYQEEPPDDTFQVMLLQLQQVGAVNVEIPTDGGYLATAPEWIRIWRTQEPLPVIAGASEFVEAMGIAQPGAAVVLSKSDSAAGQRVKGTQATLTGLADRSAEWIGYYRRSGAGIATVAIAAALPVLAVLVGVFGAVWPALALMIPAVVGLWAPRSLKTTLTDSGLAIRDQVAGLHTALSTPGAVERFDYAARVRYFAQFLPWAVALGCARQWADTCKPDFPPDHPEYRTDPTYLAAWNTYSTSQIVSGAVASVSAGAVAAYAATQAASSGGGGGGGGGFSSGGGSGGGGGGSW